MRKKEVNLKEIKFCVPEVACKLNEMDQLGMCNGNGETSSFADTEQDKRDSKSKEVGEARIALFLARGPKVRTSQVSEEEGASWFL